MNRILAVFLFVIFNSFSYSQLRQILVLNEGAYDYQNNQILVPVTIGSFDPSSGLYTKKNEVVGARFSSDIVIDEDSYWVAADNKLAKYDLKTYEKKNELLIEGVRKIAFYKDLVIVSRGEYLKTFSSYLQIYNKNTFDLVFEIPYSDLSFTTESIIVDQGIAYVAVNNGFDFGNEVGKIVKIDLNKLKVLEIIDLGSDGKNPENLMINNNLIISLNNKNYKGSSVSLINSSTSEVSSYNLSNVNSLCGTSTLVGEVVVYQESGKTDLGSFEITSKQSGFLKNLGRSFYGMYYDPNSKFLCAAETDFRTTGKVYIYNADFNELYSFDAGVAPGYFAFDNSIAVGVNQIQQLEFEISPNPLSLLLNVKSNQAIEEIKILDFYGREIVSTDKLSVSLNGIQAGSYILMVRAKDKVAYKRFLKVGN